MQKKDFSKLSELNRKHVWHPFTQMSEWMESEPLIIEKGDGIYLYDVDGNRYIDSISSVWLTIHGHNHQHINKALKSQIDLISHSTLLGLANVPSTILAKKLVDIMPSGLEKVFYSDNGSTAVEIALKMAFQYWKLKGETKTKYVSLVNAYHGDTIGSVSVGGISHFHSIFAPLLFDTMQVSSPYCYRCYLDEKFPDCKLACTLEVENLFKEHASDVAAFVIEPSVQAAAGMIILPSGYLAEVRRLCTKYNILLIADEVAVGFGRTGKMFACEHEDVSPDFLCLSKGLTGGYLPLAVTATTKSVFSEFLGKYEEFKTFYHGHSYTGNQLGCSAAIASLEIFETDNVLNRVVEKSKFLKSALKKLAELKHVGEVRQTGLIVGIELVEDKKSRKSYSIERRVGSKVCEEALKMGLISRPLVNIIQLMPPYISTEGELEVMVDVLYKAIMNAIN